MTNKEKRKGKPRHRLYLGLAIILFFVVSGFFIAPYAEKRLVAWIDDDPFTPMCDAGHLELAFVRDWNAYTIRGDGQNKHLLGSFAIAGRYHYIFEYSPTGRWLVYEDIHSQYQRQLTIVDTQTDKNFQEIPINYYSIAGVGGMYWDWQWVNNDEGILYTNYSNLGKNSFHLSSTVNTLDNQTPQYSIHEEDNIAYSFYYSPNRSNLIIYARYGLAHYLILAKPNSDESNYSEVQRINITTLKRMEWLSDSLHLIFQDNNGIQILNFETGNVQNLLKDSNIDFHLPPDGSQLAYFSSDTGETIVINTNTNEEIWRFIGTVEDWSEQGLIYSGLADDSMSRGFGIANVENQTLSTNFTNRTNYSQINARWSLDNNSILYKFDVGRYYLARFNEDSLFRIPARYIDLDSTWTPDNRYLTYIGKNHWFYLLDLESYKSCRVVEGDGNFFTRYDWRIISEN